MPISDSKLNVIILNFVLSFPNYRLGEHIYASHLVSLNLFISRISHPLKDYN